MQRTTKHTLGALAIIVLCVVVYVLLRTFLARAAEEGSAPPTDVAELAAVRQFEDDRRTDSLRQQAHWDSIHAAWDAEKASRHAAAEARAEAYADSQRVWAARRQQWADEREARTAARQAYYDSLRATYPQKLPTGSFVEANTADAALLQRIPGIGEAYAAKIIAYRERLGGFVDASQLDEIEGLPYGISTWFRVSTPAGGVRRININRADFKTLNAHPYLTYDQTCAITNLRRRAPIRNWDDLRGSGLFTDDDFRRLTPYFTF